MLAKNTKDNFCPLDFEVLRRITCFRSSKAIHCYGKPLPQLQNRRLKIDFSKVHATVLLKTIAMRYF